MHDFSLENKDKMIIAGALFYNYTHTCTLQYIIQSNYTHIQASELVQLIPSWCSGPFPSSQKAVLCEKVSMENHSWDSSGWNSVPEWDAIAAA